MVIEQLYAAHRAELLRLGYRLLGSVTEAEDVVQDIFVSLESRAGLDQVENWSAYLKKTTVNRCLNALRAAKRKRAAYPGTWLPEPLADQADQPSEALERKETLGYALLFVLERLTPAERAAYVLREAFDMSYADIAAMLDKTEPACRKLFSRAARKLADGAPAAEVPHGTVSALADVFVKAARSGDFQPLVGLLTEQATLWSDGGGVVKAALNPIYGRERIVAFFEGIARKGVSLRGEQRTMQLNGQTAVAICRQGEPVFVFCFDFEPTTGKLRNMYAIKNPEKLAHLASRRHGPSQIGDDKCLIE